ncbi:hypothetical protein KVR01_004442 [Diaporthe batatas]|uniref:uncharacterized protein n=1 Tax=Diaporthe batatas TaxID=748121 RepID=UPI001D047D7F|nr:uncharacterized protein KVR01_004442 [Diaporthe batatas]KAG8165890.1 hypothetical protein KVR01_004442 [Diaporthe batatas]
MGGIGDCDFKIAQISRVKSKGYINHAFESVWLVENVTHIVHKAWPMSATRPTGAYEPQFQVMRNLLDIVREAATVPGGRGSANSNAQGRIIGLSHDARVPERRVPLEATRPSGYTGTEAKWVCERLLDETLNHHPGLFRAMVVRPGQIHFAFLAKSAQSLRTWPHLAGTQQWIPVDLHAAAAAELVLNPHALYPVYHLDNPGGQLWERMSPVLCCALGRVRTSPLAEADSPAGRQAMAGFLGARFERRSCGGLMLDVERAKEHSVTMAGVGPVSPELAIRYIVEWRKMGFLN